MNIGNIAKKLALSLQALALVFGVGVASVAAIGVSASPALAAAAPACGAFDPATANVTSGADCAKANGTQADLFGKTGVFKLVANTLIYLVGAISVIFMILGGLRYVTSNGDSKNVTSAKDTILYAIIGVVVALISFALVNFVITVLK